MKYYLHDSNSFNDEKITELFINFGYEGLGLFYTFLEKISQQEKPIKTEVLKHQLKVGKKLEKCWSFMESLELVSSNNGETFNKQLLNISEKYAIKKQKNAKRISEWREKQIVEENVTCSENVRNTPKVKLSKVKEIEVNIYRKFAHLFLLQNEYEELLKLYSKIQIDETLDKIENYKKNSQYKSLFLTCKNWLKKDAELKPNQETKQNTKNVNEFYKESMTSKENQSFFMAPGTETF